MNTGIQTGADKFTDAHKKKYPSIAAAKGDGIFVFKKNQLEKIVTEKRLIKPWFKNSDVSKYVSNNNADKELLLTNFIASEDQEPKAIAYLQKFKEILVNRSQPEHMLDWWDLHQIRTKDKNKTGEIKKMIFDEPKIVVPYRSYKNIFGYNEQPWFASVDVFFITAKDGVSFEPFYLLGILNSKLIYTWLYHRGKRKGQMLELYRTPLSEIPIATGTQSQKRAIEKLVCEIIDNKTADTGADTSALEGQINRLVYQIYGLNPAEIKIVEESVNA